MRFLIVILFIAAAAGCRDDGASYRFDDTQGVGIDAAATGLLIHNNTLEPVYYFAIERETSMRVDWRPLIGSTNTVPFNSTLAVPYAQIGGYHSKCEIIVYLWNETQTVPPAVRSGSMRSVIVTTP
jgi:hypothetical protein